VIIGLCFLIKHIKYEKEAIATAAHIKTTVVSEKCAEINTADSISKTHIVRVILNLFFAASTLTFISSTSYFIEKSPFYVNYSTKREIYQVILRGCF
jgi:hypothetical protein